MALPVSIPNIPAIRQAMTAITGAMTAGNSSGLTSGLQQLLTLVPPLQGQAGTGADLTGILRRLTAGNKRPTRAEVGQALRFVGQAVDTYENVQRPNLPQAAPPRHVGSGILGKPGNVHRNPLGNIQGDGIVYTPRDYQRDVVRKGISHYRTHIDGQTGKLTQRGALCLHTGMGKSVVYAFQLRELKRTMPEIFDDILVIVGCHREEPAYDLAKQIKDVLPDQAVSFMKGIDDAQELRGVNIVVGTYQQLAQKHTVETLLKWTGKKRVLFVLDEVDMVAFKGIPVDADDEGEDIVLSPDVEEEGGRGTQDTKKKWHASWIQPLVAFGILNKEGRYNHTTPHRILAGSATYDRPDGIKMSALLGPGNLFYYQSIAKAIQDKDLVGIIGKVEEVRIPPDADPALFGPFTSVDHNGKIVIDHDKVASVAGSDYAIKTAVRLLLDNLIMDREEGEEEQNRRLHLAIGWTNLSWSTLEKAMRWQQDLFHLVEYIFQIHNHLHQSTPISPRGILNAMRPFGGLEKFGEEIHRFLYWEEWRNSKSLWDVANRSLEKEGREGVIELFDALYTQLNIEARRINGSRLIATAVWDGMDKQDGHKIRPDHFSPAQTVQHFPNTKWPNGFGDRGTTLEAFRRGFVRVLWNMEIAGRGLNIPLASLGVSLKKSSRRQLVQEIGRLMRPPDGKNPHDHTQKPAAKFITLTEALEVHRVDLSRHDMRTGFGLTMDPDTREIRFHPRERGPQWVTPDPVQLDLGDGREVNIVQVGVRTAIAFHELIQKIVGKKAYEPVFIADKADALPREIIGLLRAQRFPSDPKLRRWLKNLGAEEQDVTNLMGTYHSDIAELKTTLGSGWRVVMNQDNQAA